MSSIATLTTRIGPLHIYSESALMSVMTSISLDIELKGHHTHGNHEVHYAHGNHDAGNVKAETQDNEYSREAQERMGTHSSTLDGFDISEWANYAKKKARIASSTGREIGRLKALLKAAPVLSDAMKSQAYSRRRDEDPYDTSVLDPWASASLPPLASIDNPCSDIDPWSHWHPCSTSPPGADMAFESDVVELNASFMDGTSVADGSAADFDQLQRVPTSLQHLQETVATKEDLTVTLSNVVAKVSDEKHAVNVGGVDHASTDGQQVGVIKILDCAEGPARTADAVDAHTVLRNNVHDRENTPLTYVALQAMMQEETAKFCERMQTELSVALQARAQVDGEM